jgi:hypothetical protein
MQRLRTIASFVRVLVGLFLVAQFSGVVSSPLAGTPAFTMAIESHQHHQHTHGQIDTTPVTHHGDQDGDNCCALHAFLAGILPRAIKVETLNAPRQQIVAALSDLGLGVGLGRLDRPPRPFASI